MTTTLNRSAKPPVTKPKATFRQLLSIFDVKASPYLYVAPFFILFALVGLGAVLFPFMLNGFSSHANPGAVQVIVGIAWGLAGIVFLLFGALNFFTHIGLIVNTMG